MTVRIAIDMTAAAWQGAGIGRYNRELVRAVFAVAPSDYTFVLFYAAGWPGQCPPYQDYLDALCQLRPATRRVPIPLPPRRLTQVWHRLRLPLRLEWLTGPIDAVHAPDFVLPPTHKPGIVTIHDLSYLVHPECAVPGVARYLREAVPPSLQRAQAIFADSHSTKHDLVRLLDVAASRIQVVYAAVDERFAPYAAHLIAHIREKYHLPQRFLLSGGTLEPRKNYVRLFEAYAQVQAQTSMPPLVVFGRKGWMYEDIIAAPARLGVADMVTFVDFVDDNDLPALYNLAWGFVYPSVYEGFGLPPLEAMACGTPTLVSDVSSLPEVVGDAALRVDPYDTPEIARQLKILVNDDTVRTQLRVAGPKQAQLFRWHDAAHQVIQAYHTLVTGTERQPKA